MFIMSYRGDCMETETEGVLRLLKKPVTFVVPLLLVKASGSGGSRKKF